MSNLRINKRLAIKGGLILFFLLGCARVNIQTKEPIKLDVTMRVDVYQHVSKDVNSIEDMIKTPAAGQVGKTSLIFWGVSSAYAQEGYPADVQNAIDRRRDRRARLEALEAQGVIGENAAGMTELKGAGSSDAAGIVADENNDRRAINEYVAQKNGASVDDTAKVSAKRIQADAPAGTPIEVSAGQWRVKK